MTRDPLSTTVIGGYLGAGKTTLVNALLHQAQSAATRLAVLVNDFGDVAIDAALIESADTNVMQLAGGCVCCTIGNDLLSTIASLQDTVGEVDHVLVETSGVAMPGTVAATIRIADQVRLNGVLVLADMTNLDRQLNDKYIGDTITRQLDAADLIVCTKTDLITPDQCQEKIAQLSRDYPRSRCLPTSNGQLPIELALHPDDGSNKRRGSEGPVGGVLTPRPIGQSPDHSLQYITRTYTAPDGCNLEELGKILGSPASAVLRSKGFVRDADGKNHLVQTVAGSVATRPAVLPPHAQHQLVIIGLAERLPVTDIHGALTGLGFHAVSE